MYVYHVLIITQIIDLTIIIVSSEDVRVLDVNFCINKLIEMFLVDKQIKLVAHEVLEITFELSMVILDGIVLIVLNFVILVSIIRKDHHVVIIEMYCKALDLVYIVENFFLNYRNKVTTLIEVLVVVFSFIALV